MAYTKTVWTDGVTPLSAENMNKIEDGIADMVNVIYPVGSIYMSVNNTDPGTLFGGTWEAWGAGRVPVGVDATQTEFDTAEETGGEKTHTLTTGEMPNHSHEIPTYASSGGMSAGFVANAGLLSSNAFRTTSEGSGQAHNNLQPYITCYMWKRTA